MTYDEAIHILKMLINNFRGEFYPDTRMALTMGINALYDVKNGLLECDKIYTYGGERDD